MGAEAFVTYRQKASSPEEAFGQVHDDHLYEYGHRGYTGTMAEKHSYRMIPYSEDSEMTPEDFAWHMIDVGDPRIDDKWGPAGCIDCGDGSYIFFGWASS